MRFRYDTKAGFLLTCPITTANSSSPCLSWEIAHSHSHAVNWVAYSFPAFFIGSKQAVPKVSVLKSVKPSFGDAYIALSGNRFVDGIARVELAGK